METRNVAPVKLELFVAVVHDKKASYYSSIIQSHQANIQFFTPCTGVTHLLLSSLGLTPSPKTLLASVVRSDEAQGLVDFFRDTIAKGKEYKGIAFTIPLTSVIGTLVYGFLSNERTTVK
ncbi:MAG: hypothetical protein J6S97_05905 [Bacteroidales bacterium]|nr:hypothetical protein [Bacteroidales bacterium]MBP5522462.1 hypothetical protein [Bacteroidales bacterium]